MLSRYERIIGGLYNVVSVHDGHWVGFCLETVLSDGNPEPHPLLQTGTFPRAGSEDKARVVAAKVVKAKPAPPAGPAGLSRGEIAWNELVSRMVGDDMMNTCRCSCTAAENLLATNDPLGCTCHCPPQNGERGRNGVHGPLGERGERGKLGRPGMVGPLGDPGRLPQGTYPFDVCDCYTEDWRVDMNELGWAECNKPGYLLQGIWRDTCDVIECANVGRCCRPCLKIVDLPPEPSLRFMTRQSTETSFAAMLPTDFEHLYESAPEHTEGYCTRYISDFFHESNRATCYHTGSTKSTNQQAQNKTKQK